MITEECNESLCPKHVTTAGALEQATRYYHRTSFRREVVTTVNEPIYQFFQLFAIPPLINA